VGGSWLVRSSRVGGEPAGGQGVFTPRKFQAKTVARIGGDLWGYLVGGREQADYYLGADGTPTEATAALHGRLWARLGLARLDRAAFQRLAAGCHPVTGQRLVKTSHITRLDPVTGTAVSAGGFHVPGVDCNLSPPKSVSALLPFVSHRQRAELEEAHLAAVRVTLEELEVRVAACRPTVHGEQVHTPGELGVAVFTHHTSRPTSEVAAEPGRPPDPQLHSHAFVFNLAFCQGRYLAVDSRPLYQFATTAGPDLVQVVLPEGPKLTTRVLLQQERRIVAVAAAKATTRVLAPRPELLARTVELSGLGGRRLSAEQQAALRHLARPVGWASLEGHAGTGKTTTIHALVRAYRADGQPVVLVTTAAETARRTARDLGLERGYTVEAFTRAVERGELEPGASWVVLVEEAAMMDTHRMAALLEAAGPASIRTLGDPEQAQAVGAAGWHQLVDQAIGGHAQLTRVVRQRHRADREVCRAIRDGHTHQALANLQARGRLHLSPDRPSAVKEIVHAWDRHRRSGGLDGVRIVTDTDNRTVDTLNALCQAKRRTAGELNAPSITIIDRINSRCERLFVGDRVQFIRPFIAGDLLRSYVANGTGGVVLAVDPGDGVVTIDCDDRRIVTLRPGGLEEAQPLRLGYAGHALKLQGGQAEVVLVLPGGWQTSRQSAYSMATRCVEELHVFVDTATQQTGPYRDCDPVQALGERWTRDAKKLAATSHLDRSEELDGMPGGRSLIDDDLVAAPPEPWELARSLEPHQPALARDFTDGLGIDPNPA